MSSGADICVLHHIIKMWDQGLFLEVVEIGD